MHYQPGLHLIATLQTEQTALLEHYAGTQQLLNTLVDEFRLRKLGEVYHDFDPAGFTAVICLSESHLSIHTWPEFGKINLDIYLSNYERVNDHAVTGIFERLVEYFHAIVTHKTMITR